LDLWLVAGGGLFHGFPKGMPWDKARPVGPRVFWGEKGVSQGDLHGLALWRAGIMKLALLLQGHRELGSVAYLAFVFWRWLRNLRPGICGF
jgi:hypothetical protein